MRFFRAEYRATIMTQPASLYRMLRWSHPLAALFILALAIPSAFPQFGGSRYPGGMGGGPRFPGQSGPTTPSTPKAFGPTETLTGTLRDVSTTNLVIDAGDDRIVLIQIQDGTKYLSTMGKVKATDFEPGDHVTIEATRDSNDRYFSKTVTMNKKGTAEDKAAALKAGSGTSGSGGGDSPDSDPDRPRLRRNDSDSSSSSSQGASSGNSSSAISNNSGASSSNSSSDSGSDRPRLRRTGSDDSSSSGDQASVYTPAPRSISGGSAPSGTVPLITGSDSVDSSTTVAPRRPASSQPSTSYPSSPSNYPSSSDDSGPPSLRRANSGNTDSSSASVQSASNSRPTLSAADDNGVTRLPTLPPPNDPDAPRGQNTPTRGGYSNAPGGGDPVIDEARDAAFSFSETLPNYVVKQFTNRYQSGAARGGRTSWQPLDIVTTDLIYEDGKERYTNILVNGKPTKYIEQTGSWSEGEFGSMLQAILSPSTNADFRNQRSSTIVNRPAYRYDYTVEQPRSTWSLHADGQTYSPSYTGAIWIDKATYRVLRIEISARNLPRGFPLDTAESSIDYDFVQIGDQKVLMPAHAEALSCSRGTSDCTRNTTDYRNYKKYGAESSISFEGEK